MLSVNPERAASSSGSDTISEDEMSLLVLTATTHTPCSHNSDNGMGSLSHILLQVNLQVSVQEQKEGKNSCLHL